MLHLKQPEDVSRLAAVQENLLRAAVEMLRPGGMLVYCTCSLERQEGHQAAASWAAWCRLSSRLLGALGDQREAVSIMDRD